MPMSVTSAHVLVRLLALSSSSRGVSGVSRLLASARDDEYATTPPTTVNAASPPVMPQATHGTPCGGGGAGLGGSGSGFFVVGSAPIPEALVVGGAFASPSSSFTVSVSLPATVTA